MTVDQIALLPAYVSAGVAVLVLLTDLGFPGRSSAVLGVASCGAAAVAVTAIAVGAGTGTRRTFCVFAGACSLVADRGSAVVATLFALLTLGVLALSAPLLRSGHLPAGEYCFLLACSMTGGVVLGSTRDLISLIVALETLTLPLYVLVGLRRRPSEPAARGSAAALTFFLVSVVSTTVALLGAALLYAATGAVHLATLAAALGGTLPPGVGPLATVGVVLLLTGLGFKVAAVPLHAWAPPTYDGAPLPVAAYLSTASKLGGVVALTLVTVGALQPVPSTAGPTLAGLAVLTMTVGNLAALRQRRMVRLLAWSSIAQAGYILAPLGGLVNAHGGERTGLVTATVAYTVFFVVIELAAFGALVAIRGTADGGDLADYRGVGRRAPWPAALLALALAGLAGLPPGLAGLFGKVVVVRSLLGGGSAWLAVIVALNAVVGLAYYVRVATTLFSPAGEPASPAGEPAAGVLARVSGVPAPVGASELAGSPASVGASEPAGSRVLVEAPEPAPIDVAEPRVGPVWPVGLALGVASLAAVVVGFAPQLVLDVAAYVHP